MRSATVGAYDQLRAAVLRRLERERIAADRDLEAVRLAILEEVERYQRSAHLGVETALHDPGGMVGRLLASVTAFGPLTDVLVSPEVEEVFIEGARVTWLDRRGRLHGLDHPTTADENRQVVDRLLAATQRALDARHPLVQARVLDGAARLSAAIPPVADELSATIRRHALRRDTLLSLVQRGALTTPAAGLLWAAMQSGASILVSGPPGAGKTSLLAALLGAVPATRCVRVCEEIRELSVPLTLGACYEARPAGMGGDAEISLRDLIKFSLGMRPDLIVVGEVRGAEAFELTRAVNAGSAFACTVHANGAREALEAVTNAALMAGENVPERVVRKVLAQAIDLVVHLDLSEERDGELRREVREIIALVPALHDDFSTEGLFGRPHPGGPLTWSGALPAVVERIGRRLPPGVDLRAVLAGRQVVT